MLGKGMTQPNDDRIMRIRQSPFFASLYLPFGDTSFLQKHKLILLTSVIAFLQFLLHLGAMRAYGFHQDELLYITLGDHLSWGYRETPPFIAFMSKISEWLFGDSIIGMRLLPAIFAGAIVHLTGLIVIKLGGKNLAVLLACTMVGFSPAFLATGGLFIPQVFDAFFWLACCYTIMCMIHKPDRFLPYLLGALIGLAILTKYTIVIYLAGMLPGIWFHRASRPVLKWKNFLKMISVVLLLTFPHLIWQYQNGFPALLHLGELQKTQLVYLSRMDFLLQQLLSNGMGLFIWLAGIAGFFYYPELRRYAFILSGFLVVMLVLMLFHGKPYYGFGAYPALFAVGATSMEKLLTRYRKLLKISLITLLLLPNLLLALVVLPYLPIQKTSRVFQWTYQHWKLDFPLRWEDQRIHLVNQNFADMIGWEELAIKTSRYYMTLQPAKKKQTIILAEGYGAAAAFTYYSRKYPMPKIVSLSSSFAMWAPRTINARNLIFFSSENIAVIPRNSIRFASINNPYSRIYGRGIYLCPGVNQHTLKWYASRWTEKQKDNFDFGKTIRYGNWL